MIIWSRWGFLTFLAIGAGVALGFGTTAVLRLPTTGPIAPLLIFGWAALINVALVRWVYPRLDRPRPVTLTRPLSQPYTWPDGRVQTHEVVPVLDPEGNHLWTAPSSTLFFIPVRFWGWILAGIALTVGILGVFS